MKVFILFFFTIIGVVVNAAIIDVNNPTIQISNMATKTGGKLITSDGTWRFDTQGRATNQIVVVANKTYKFSVSAYGVANGTDKPQLQIIFDENKVLPITITVDSSTLKTYSFEYKMISGGTRSISVAYINDTSTTAKSVNVKSLTVGAVTPAVVKANTLGVSASAQDGANVASNIIDNDLLTRWSADGIGRYIDIYLDGVYSVSQIELSFYKGDTRSTYFTVELYSNNKLITAIGPKATSVKSTGLVNYPISVVNTTTSLRITGFGNQDVNNNWISVNEVKVYGAKISSSTTIVKIPAPVAPPEGDQKISKSVTRGGITWVFAKETLTGKYANGDPWAVGPVQLVQMTPGPTTLGGKDINGSMLNIDIKAKPHGFDGHITYLPYDANLNIGKKLPYDLKAGDMLLSSVHNNNYVGAAGTNDSFLREIQVLTIVASAPASGTFRPPYIGRVGKTSWNESKLNYAKLRSLAKPNGGLNVPSLTRLTDNFKYPWIYKNEGAGNSHFRPLLNHPYRDDSKLSANYGRELSHMASEALLSLQLNYTKQEKRNLTVSMVQIGIDAYGAVQYGSANFYADGGHNNGHKMPILFAASLLDDGDMFVIAAAHSFQEDQQTFYVDQTTVNITNSAEWAPDTRNGVEPYKISDIGLPEWGIRHMATPQADNKHLDATYRHVSSPSFMGQALAAQLMGLKTQWNWSAFFDYADRYYGLRSTGASNSPNSIQLFVKDMWDEYR